MNSTKDVRIEEQKVAYQGFFQIHRYRLKHRLFAGGWSESMVREVFERGSAVCVLLYDPNLEKVVLIEQFRIGAYRDPKSPWLIELVAGVIDKPDESLEAVARRETQEEAGVEIIDIMPIYQYWVSPGGCTEQVQLFCAKIDSSAAGGIHGLAEEHEDIQVLVWDFKQALKAIEEGDIRNAPAIIALQWLQLNHAKVQQAWKN